MTASATHLRVASAQYPLDAATSFNAWAAKVSRWVADGTATGARLLVFPEYGTIEIAAIHGPAVTADLAATLHAVADAQPAMAGVWSRLAHVHGVHILAPSGPERRASGFVNAARLFTPTGRVGVQDKLILTPFERDWGMQPGSGLAVFATTLGSIAINICYDSEFPLLARAQVAAGADLLLVPSCTEAASGWRRVRIGATARALEGQIAAVVSPTVGDAPWSPAIDRNTGTASILLPPDASLSLTGVLAEGALDEPGWIVADIDIAGLRRLRTVGEMRNRADWALQPGASATDLAAIAIVHDLG